MYKSKKDSKKSEKSLEVSEKPLPILLELLDTLDSNNFTAYGTWFDLLMTCKNVGISYESFDTFSNNDGVLFYRVSKKTFLVYNKTTCLWEYLENDEVVLPSRINKCISPIIEKHLTVVKNKLKYLELNFKSLI